MTGFEPRSMPPQKKKTEIELNKPIVEKGKAHCVMQ
jgi:hypothetical protein